MNYYWTPERAIVPLVARGRYFCPMISWRTHTTMFIGMPTPMMAKRVLYRMLRKAGIELSAIRKGMV